MKRFNTVPLALGLPFLLCLIEKTGWRRLALQFRVLGWGITLILPAGVWQTWLTQLAGGTVFLQTR